MAAVLELQSHAAHFLPAKLLLRCHKYPRAPERVNLSHPRQTEGTVATPKRNIVDSIVQLAQRQERARRKRRVLTSLPVRESLFWNK